MPKEMVGLERLFDGALESATASYGLEGRSEEAQEIINRRPGFFEKWALMVFLLVLVVLAIGTWFISYPDVVEAQATLTSHNAPKEIVPRQSGRIVDLFAKNGQDVRQGDILAWVEGSGNPVKISALAKGLEKGAVFLARGKPEEASRVFNRRHEDLGEIQSAYQTFVIAWQKYNDYLVNDFYNSKKFMLKEDIRALELSGKKTIAQLDLLKEDTALSKKSFEMNTILFNDKVLSEEQYRIERSKLLSKLMSVPQLEVALITFEGQKRDKRREIEQIDHDSYQQKKTFEQALYTLKSGVNDWIRLHAIIAPCNGKVVFIKPVQKDQTVVQGKPIGHVSPGSGEQYAEIWLPQGNFGKVDTGMKVQLRFDAYPYQEVGIIEGRLDYLSSVASDSGFLGSVRLENGLVANQGKKIPYKNGLRGTALVITRDMSVAKRLYHNMVKATSLNK